MNKKKLFKWLKKFSIFSLVLIFACTILAGCKKPSNPSNEDEPPIETPKVSLICNVDEIEINVDEKQKIGARLENNEDGVIIWQSGDESIVSVSADGLVEPKGVGITTITLTYSLDKTISKTIVVYSYNTKIGEYPITFDFVGGTYSGNVPTSYNIFKGLNTLPSPTKEGYKFIGWDLNGQIVDKISTSHSGILRLTAKYSKYPTNLYIEDLKEDMWVGKTYQLTIHEDVKIGEYTYESSDDSILTVDNNGLITGVSSGRATVTVTSVNNPETTDSINIFVYGKPESFTLKNNVTSVFLGRKLQLRVNANPAKSYANVIWTTNDTDVLTISDNGTVTTVGVGTATVRATSTAFSDVYAEFTLEVLQPATKVEIATPEKTSLYIDETIQLTAKVYPLEVSQSIIWRISDPSIATIDETGFVKVLNRGEVTITAMSELTSDVFDQIKIKCLHPLLQEENADVKYIISAPGTDASTMISINYHAMNTKTFIEYTVASDTDFSNATSVIPNGVYFEETDPVLSNPFPARNIFSSEITGLAPNTPYIFRINCGDNTYSDTYHFTTAKGTNEDFSFVWLTDNHYNTIYAGAETSEYTIHKAMEMRDQIGFVLDTGDMIDTGGNSAIWDLMFTQRKTLLELPMISTTGNHELYVNGTGQWDNRFHAAYNALPKNGVEGKIGTSCYFYYNDVLFILIEDVAASSYTEQFEWMENLLREAREEKKARLVIASMHAPIQSEDPSNSKNDRDMKIMGLFDKYGVDLVLTGHYHWHNVVRNYYNGVRSNNPLLGVNYMMGSPAGAKGANGQDLKEFAKGYIVDVKGNSIIVTQIDANGKIIDTNTFNSIKYEEMTDEAKNASKEDIINSLNYSLDADNNIVNFNWTANAYGNVEKIMFNEIYRNEISREFYVISPAYTYTTLSSVFPQMDYKFLVTFYFKDGTTATKEIEIKRSVDINIRIDSLNVLDHSVILKFDEANNNISNKIKYYVIYLNGQKVEMVAYLNNYVAITSYILNNLDLTVENVISIHAVDKNEKTIFERSITIPAQLS